MDALSLPLEIWNIIVEYLPVQDLHSNILSCKDMYNMAHALQPQAWRTLVLNLTTPANDETSPLKSTSKEQIRKRLQHARYRGVTSLNIKGAWDQQFLLDILKYISDEPRELEIDRLGDSLGAILQVGRHLTKLVIGYTEEPSLLISALKICPNLEYFEMKPAPLNKSGFVLSHPVPIPPDLPSLCPLLHTFGWTCFPLNRYDLSPISKMRNLRTISLSNIHILENVQFYTNVIHSGLPLQILELHLSNTLEVAGLATLVPLAATLHTLRLYNCSYSLTALELEKLPHLRSVTYYMSAMRECDFETIDLLTTLHLDMLEIRFQQASFRAIQLRDRFLQLMASKPYKLTTRGTLYDTFCYNIYSKFP